MRAWKLMFHMLPFSGFELHEHKQLLMLLHSLFLCLSSCSLILHILTEHCMYHVYVSASTAAN